MQVFENRFPRAVQPHLSLLSRGAAETSAWLTQEDSTRFAAFRIILGLVLLADITHLYAHRGLFSSMYPSHLPIAPELILWMIVLVCMIIGYHAQVATIANYVCGAFILGVMAPRQGFLQRASDSVAISLCVLAAVLPCYFMLTVDRFGAGRRASSTIASARWLLVGYLSSVYLDSGIHKLKSHIWSAGLGVTTPMSLPSLVWTSTAWMTWFPAWLLRLSGWGVIAFELLFPALYAWRRTRVVALLTGIALHIGIAWVYPIPIFSGLMIAVYAGLLPETWYARLRQVDKWIALRGRNANLAEPPPASQHCLSLRWPAIVMVFWLLCLGVVHSHMSPLRRLQKVILATTGINGYEVFADRLFVPYRYQVRLIPVGETDRAAVPYSRDGLFAWSVRDRLWELWWKVTQAPWTPVHESELQLATWAAVYWPLKAAPITVRIEARPQHVELHSVDPTLFSRNNAVAWQEVGSIQLNGGAVPVTKWIEPPESGEQLLGDYLARVLPDAH